MEGQDNKRRKIEREATLLHWEQIASLREKIQTGYFKIFVDKK